MYIDLEYSISDVTYFEYIITLSLKWVLLDLMLLNSTDWKVQLSKSTWLNIILVNL